jgi:hypothetical protein
MAVDATAGSGVGPLNDPTHQFRSDTDLPGARSYGFGDVFASSRGFRVPTLSTYLATHFRLAGVAAPAGLGAAPIATWWDRGGSELRAVWGEVRDVFDDHAFAPLRLRAGRQYVDGPWITHADAVTVAWDGRLVTASLSSGVRVADYAPRVIDEARARLLAATVRVDLRGLRTPLPLAITADALQLTAGAETRHGQLTADWRPRRDLAVVAEVRALSGALASERLQLRGRYRQVSNIVVELGHRHAADWRWDPSLAAADEPGAPRRYLELGAVLPRLTGSARAGTVLFDNLDLLLRGAFALDQARAVDASTMSASWLELGGALEVRLRRTIAVGASLSTRAVRRAIAPERDNPGIADPLAPNPAMGETGLIEGGASARMSLGARTFSALLEAYGRSTRYARIYQLIDPMAEPIRSQVFRAGGRFTVDAWIGRELRLFASYDLSTSLTLSPEVAGYKSLRLMVEGVF